MYGTYIATLLGLALIERITFQQYLAIDSQPAIFNLDLHVKKNVTL
jgi:hypothetical protein